MEFGYSIQLILTLGIVAVGLYVALKYAKIYQEKNFSGGIKIIDRRAIDQGVNLIIVEVEGIKYLMGVSNKDIKIISELPK